MDKEILGYVPCLTCMTPKSIIQGSGKRQAFVYGRCECGVDNRTGKAAQAEMKTYTSIEEVQAAIEAKKQEQSEPIPEEKPVLNEVVETPQSESETKSIGTATCVGIGAVTGLVLGGVIKVIQAVA